VLTFHVMSSLRRPFTFRVFLAFALFSTGALTGCAIGSDDIQHWKQTQKGPEKILKVMSSDRYAIELRSEAALAMVELDRTDVAGLHELATTLDAMASSEPQAVEAIVRDLAPRLSSMMKGKPGEPATPAQVRAKDAAFKLVPFAEGQVRDQLIGDLVAFYVEDFPARSLAGDVSAEQVARKLGDVAVSRMIDAMSAKMPPEALTKLAELMAELGDAATKERAAERLVAIQREMESDEYLAWLTEEIKAQQAAQPEALDEARLSAMASLNREKFINQGALAAMKRLAGQEKVAARLLEVAADKPSSEGPELLVEIANDRRKTALLALEGNAKPSHLSRLLPIALDADDSLEVRDHAFDRIAETKSTDAIAPMWPLVQSSVNEELPKRLRWRAGELVLALGGPAIVEEFLRKLPAGPMVEYEPAELGGYAAKMAAMSEPPTAALRNALRGGPWFRSVIAARYLAERGEASDRALLQQLAGSRLGLVGDGWDRVDPQQKTVGDVARTASATLEKRLSGDSGESAKDS
jgi:hypothetical protein